MTERGSVVDAHEEFEEQHRKIWPVKVDACGVTLHLKSWDEFEQLIDQIESAEPTPVTDSVQSCRL